MMLNESLEYSDSCNNYVINLTLNEKIKCLREISNKLGKILYVYDKSGEKDSKYDYKLFCKNILIYVCSSNSLFDGELVNAIINLNSIINNDFDKKQLKSIVFETKNEIEFLLKKYQEDDIVVMQERQLNPSEDC